MAPIPITLDNNGHFSSLLWANDDTATQPAGTGWQLNGTVDGMPFDETYLISHTFAPTVDISGLTPAALGSPLFDYAATAEAFASALVAVERSRAIAAEAPVLFTQSIAASTWTITHNLGYKPLVSMADSAGNAMFASVLHVSNNQLTINFSIPQTGSATLR
jgi:hypothetical protein